MNVGRIRLALIGCGAVAQQNYLPALRFCPQASLEVVCDKAEAVARQVKQHTGARAVFTDPIEALDSDLFDAVIITTPNRSHAQIAIEAVRRGKHVLCEKPLAASLPEAWEMFCAAEEAGVRHMTAFTYRFVPAFRYLLDLVRSGDLGRIYHLRTCRLQDWKDRHLGWRQFLYWAGTGEIGDMLSHRIDWANCVAGDIASVMSMTSQFVPIRGGAVSELEDWVGVLVRFRTGATGVLESSKVATGMGESWRSRDLLEVHGEKGSVMYLTENWDRLVFWPSDGSGPKELRVPREYWTWPGTSRDINEGNPLITFRYDQLFEFIKAIEEDRPCAVSFYDGLRVQVVMEAIRQSAMLGKEIKIDGIMTQLEGNSWRRSAS